MSQKTVYMPPEAKIVILKDFDLAKIEDTFQYASFERRISKTKTHKIAQAMVDNKFSDNVLRMFPSKGAVDYDVIDGQHRIEGLRYARDNFGLASYDLILFIYDTGDRREIYRRLNLGKPLTLSDHLKALDNGKSKFFIDLRDTCDHYTKGSKVRYAQAVNCLHYAKSTSIRPVKPLAIDDFIQAITDRDTNLLNKFIPILHQIATNPNSMFYHYTVMRNLFRIYYENTITNEKMVELGKVLATSKQIKELSDKRDNHAMRGIYHYIIDRAAPEIDLQLRKGIVKEK